MQLSDIGFVHDPELGILKCTACVKDVAYNPDKFRQPGFFVFDVAKGGKEFNHVDVLSSRFRTLKAHIKDHISSNGHKEEMRLAAKARGRDSRLLNRNQAVGMRVGQTAYIVFKGGFGLRIFEELLMLQEMNGLDIGISLL